MNVKLKYHPTFIQHDPIGAYRAFDSNVTKYIEQKCEIDAASFYSAFKEFADNYRDMGEIPMLNILSEKLLKFLENKKQTNLAGIMYSVLIKFNKNNPQKVENLAKKALELEKRKQDAIHIVSRAYDLADVYAEKAPGSDEHIKYLRIINKSLKDICKNYYVNIRRRYKNISRELKPLECYELMLCFIKTEIAKYSIKNQPNCAKYELEEAEKILSKYDNECDFSRTINLRRKVKSLKRMLNESDY